jgi:hypothetical protein
MRTISLGWVLRTTFLVALWIAHEFGAVTLACTTDTECLQQCAREGGSFEQCDGYPEVKSAR